MKTTAAVLRTAGAALSLEDVEIENPRPDEVLVRLLSSGVCHTDLGVMASAAAEQMPVVLGHEGAGIVEAVGDDVHSIESGDHVVLTYNFCGSTTMRPRRRPSTRTDGCTPAISLTPTTLVTSFGAAS